MSTVRISFLLDTPTGDELMFTCQPIYPHYLEGQTIFLEKKVLPGCKEKEIKLTQYVITKVHHAFKESVRCEGTRTASTDTLSVEVYVKKSK